MVLDNEMLEIKKYFEPWQVLLSDAWLESCVNWYREQNSDATYSIDQLRKEVYTQWLILDFRDVEIPTLPPDLSLQKKSILQRNFCLQMLYIVDISKAKHLQLQKLRNMNTLTSVIQKDDETPAKRVLQMRLTDGLQEINAIEYKTIPELNVNIVPGTKIRIIGPVTVRRGNLMIEPKNVKILGGEVEEIIISNAFENVLARSLNLPENRFPNTNCNFTDVHNEVPLPVREPIPNRNELEILQAHETSENITEEEKELQIAGQILLETENNRNNSASMGTSDNVQDMFEAFDFDAAEFDNIDEAISSIHDNKSQSVSNVKDQNEVIDLRQLLDSEDDIIFDANPMEIDKKSEIRKIISVLGEEPGGQEIKIKAKFKCVTEKLTIQENKWLLKMQVADETGEMEVRVHNDVILNLMGYTAEDVNNRKNNIHSCSRTRDEILQAIENFKSKLTALNCVMQLKMEMNTLPIVIGTY